MSDKLGPIAYGEKEEMVFLGKDLGEQRNYSEAVAAKIDEEVTKFIREAQAKTVQILKKKRRLLDKVANRLAEKETIEREEFEKLVKIKREQG
jgi:cell division protease FtsH